MYIFSCNKCCDLKINFYSFFHKILQIFKKNYCSVKYWSGKDVMKNVRQTIVSIYFIYNFLWNKWPQPIFQHTFVLLLCLMEKWHLCLTLLIFIFKLSIVIMTLWIHLIDILLLIFYIVKTLTKFPACNVCIYIYIH